MKYQQLKKKNIVYNDKMKFNLWLEQWIFSYKRLAYFKNLSNVKFICYEDLCDTYEVFESILQYIGANLSTNFDFFEELKKRSLPVEKLS